MKLKIITPMSLAVPGLMTTYACYLSNFVPDHTGNGFNAQINTLSEGYDYVETEATYAGGQQTISGFNYELICGAGSGTRFNAVTNLLTTAITKSYWWYKLGYKYFRGASKNQIPISFISDTHSLLTEIIIL